MGFIVILRGIGFRKYQGNLGNKFSLNNKDSVTEWLTRSFRIFDLKVKEQESLPLWVIWKAPKVKCYEECEMTSQQLKRYLSSSPLLTGSKFRDEL